MLWIRLKRRVIKDCSLLKVSDNDSEIQFTGTDVVLTTVLHERYLHEYHSTLTMPNVMPLYQLWMGQFPHHRCSNTTKLIPMTHTPETGAENRLHFSGAGFWYACHGYYNVTFYRASSLFLQAFYFQSAFSVTPSHPLLFTFSSPPFSPLCPPIPASSPSVSPLLPLCRISPLFPWRHFPSPSFVPSAEISAPFVTCIMIHS